MNAHGQDIPQVEKRADHFNFNHRSFSCVEMLTMHEPVKSNLPAENIWMHIVRRYRKWKREQTTLISQIILLCWNANHAWTSEK